jgi:predicted HTH domain antitoxin
MRQHAVRTAMTLYQGGTLSLESAADYAGLATEEMRSRLRRRGLDVSTPEPERVAVAAD